MDDAALVLISTTTNVAVLANDSDPDGNLDPSTLAVVAGPSIGTATVTGTTIRCNVGIAIGATSFTYRVCDTTGRCAVATVRLTIVAI